MSNDIHSLLRSDDKDLPLAKNAPATFFRMVLADMNVTPSKWDAAMRRHFNELIATKQLTPKESSGQRSNLNRALAKPTITWKAFRRGVDILGPKHMSFELSLVWDPNIQLPQKPPEYIEFTPERRMDDLKRLYQDLLVDIGFTPKVWNRLVDRFLNRRQRLRKNPVDRSTERGNLNSSLLESSSFTWNNLMVGLAVVGVDRGNLAIVLDWGKRKTIHAMDFNCKEY